MDVYRYLKELHAHKRSLDKTIARLEAALAKDPGRPASPGGRRGRKPGMSTEEREIISQRMRSYWARRRAQAVAGSDPDVAASSSSSQTAGA